MKGLSSWTSPGLLDSHWTGPDWEALQNVAPVLEVRSRRVGGATYQVPVDVREERRIALAIRWVRTYSRARRDKTMASRLANELLAAYKNATQRRYTHLPVRSH